MTTNKRHTPMIRLQAAQSAYRTAVELCPHWDYMSWQGDGHDCCYQVADTEREVRLARKAVSK